jgi:hypothetical protein
VLRQSENDWVFGGELLIPVYMQKGTAVDAEYFPDANPRVIYEAKQKWSVLVGGRAGKAIGSWLPSAFVAVGLAGAEGRTLNVDDNDQYSPGFVQSATATHIVYQIGGGADVQLNETYFAGARILAFNANQQKYEMPWNAGEDDDFGMHSLLVQVHVNRWF